jgi:hypothetical protein
MMDSTYCDPDVGHTSVADCEVLDVLPQLDNGAHSLVPGDKLLEWEVRLNPTRGAHTYRESGGEFALVYVAIGTANTYETRICTTAAS